MLIHAKRRSRELNNISTGEGGELGYQFDPENYNMIKNDEPSESSRIESS